jgi:dsDNA-specific endonuclease/ATPase MutS2
LFVTTTHYPEIKDYAKSTPGLVNARMSFDLQSLMPLYQLEIGEAGESCALYIARRLGLPQRMIDRAGIAAYGSCNNEKPQKTVHHYPDSNIPAQGNELSQEKEAIIPAKRIKPQEIKKSQETPRSAKFNIGDSVMIYPQKMIGIVFQRADEKGDIGVQVKGKKLLLNHKRLKLHVAANELYPDNYDFSIIFDSVENRKKRHSMERKHDPNLIIE